MTRAVNLTCNAYIVTLTGSIWASNFAKVDELIGLVKTNFKQKAAQTGHFLKTVIEQYFFYV